MFLFWNDFNPPYIYIYVAALDPGTRPGWQQQLD